VGFEAGVFAGGRGLRFFGLVFLLLTFFSVLAFVLAGGSGEGATAGGVAGAVSALGLAPSGPVGSGVGVGAAAGPGEASLCSVGGCDAVSGSGVAAVSDAAAGSGASPGAVGVGPGAGSSGVEPGHRA